MKLIHNSRLPQYRSPFGAVTVGTTVSLSLYVEDRNENAPLNIVCRTWIDGVGENMHPMKETEHGKFDVQIECNETCLVWYSFIVQSEGVELCRVGAPEGREGGESVTYYSGSVPSYQITVYKHRETRPAWYEGGMVYQIFPDRYARDDAWRERTEAQIDKPRAGIQRHLIEDWTQPPVYDRNPDWSIRSWDFYGGSLKGIENDIPRIAEMGFTAIYLNPIFEASSNHRYDTGDFLKIDPILGNEEDFKSLCKTANEHGIGIILDGVFNHTGDDSRYFNRYHNYPGPSVEEDVNSEWHDAFNFHEDGTYEAWWGIGNMPSLNEKSPLVQKLFFDEDGVIRHWLRAGASGWRLDVADELTDDFLAKIKQAAVAEKKDTFVLGEVWEDASNKVSYSQLKRYLLGDELDSAMNYPFRDMVLGFLLGGETAYQAAERIETLRENYPAEALHCALNLLGSHDRPRIASVLGEAPDETQVPESERGSIRMNEGQLGLAKARFWLASLMQMTFPGVPSVYYGDEFGMEGLTDPGNRRPLLPEDMRDYDFYTILQNASSLRRALPFLKDGDVDAFAADREVLGYSRHSKSGDEHATILINRDGDNGHTVEIAALGEAATDVISGKELEVADGKVRVEMYPFGSAVIYFHKKQMLQEPLDEGAGAVCHITSVPTDDGKPGTLGEASKRFIDHIAEMGFKYWQVLPVNPTDFFRSPYAGPSAFAGNVDLLPESKEELEADFKAWLKKGGEKADPLYTAFKNRNESWIYEYCAFMAVKKHTNGISRHEWPEEFKAYDEKLLHDERLVDEIALQGYMQYRFDLAWAETMNYAHSKGLKIIGDIPMYVSDDSADAWSYPEMFNLDDTGKALQISGAPPDAMSADGQVWGNPTFRWDYMKSTGYSWWLMRLRRAFALYDRVRLDHFLGFHNYYSIPAGKKCADGRWLPGPGKDLFQAAYDELGPLNFIAEDLGYLTPGVRAMSATCGFPGMDVLEFADYDIRQGIRPTPGKILFTSTHDTSTFLGFCGRAYAGGNEEAAKDTCSWLIEEALKTDAPLVMMPLQDVLLLGDADRMNTPGVATGNWSWQAKEADVEAAVQRTTELLARTGRSRKEA